MNTHSTDRIKSPLSSALIAAMPAHHARSRSAAAGSEPVPSQMMVLDNSANSTTTVLTKSATTIFTNPLPTLLPRSATTIFTAPAHVVAAAPKALLSTLLDGLKHAAKAVVGRRKEIDTTGTSQSLEDAEEECDEDIDEWEEVDGEEVRHEMRRVRLMLRQQRKHNMMVENRGENKQESKGRGKWRFAANVCAC
ncbi:hypothetical protein SLS60_003556 [Paraconiothyrium brasiliense]|uniref:Uncharacterized protein n=1 Tax=Paraconiothyrium brasiliense TaxID=300254 RepID=A0ABR3RNY6_9PLEO